MKKKCIGCERKNKKVYAWGVCKSCYARMNRLFEKGHSVVKIFKNDMLKDYWLGRNTDGSFRKGNLIGGETRVKIGQRLSKKTEFKRGNRHPNWEGKYSRSHHIYRKDYENALGRKLKKEEVIHHLDGNHQNNGLGNLIVFSSHSDHMKFHWEIQKKKRIKGRLKTLKGGV